MTPMFRSLALLITALVVGGQAHAFSPEGAVAPVTDFGGRHGFAIGVTGVDTTLADNPTDDRLTMTRMATLGLSWSYGGFSAGVSGGQMHYAQYVLPTFSVGSANLASVSLSHAITDVSGGTLAVGLSAHRYYFDQSAIDEVAASLRWSRKF
jgi:hypothetical protein